MSTTRAAVCANHAQRCAPSEPQKPQEPIEIKCQGDLRMDEPLDPNKYFDELELPEAHLFPEQLITELKQRLRVATGENGRLRHALATEENSMATRANRAAARRTGGGAVIGASGGAGVDASQGASGEAGVISLAGSNHLAAKQIVALAKRVRQLTAEGESTKRQLLELRQKEGAKTEAAPLAAAPEREPRASEGARKADTVEHLQEQLNATKLRLCESRNQCQELKQRLQQANKALEDEVGAGAGDSRRGRAQQIIALQRKVSKLQAQLQPPGPGMEDKLAPRVRHEERERRAAADKMAANLEAATQAQEAARVRVDAARARCKALEAENAAQRKRIESLIDDAEKDARIIEAIKLELSASTEREAVRTRELSAAAQWRVQCEFLREELRRVQHGVAEAKVVGEPKVEELVAVDSPGTQATIEHLLVLTARLELRVTQERRVSHDAQLALRREQVRSARLQTRLASLEATNKAQASTSSRGYATRREVDRVNDAAQLAAELLREELLAAQAELACVEHDKLQDLQLFTAALKEAHTAAEEGKKIDGSSSQGDGQDAKDTSLQDVRQDPLKTSQDAPNTSPRFRQTAKNPSQWVRQDVQNLNPRLEDEVQRKRSWVRRDDNNTSPRIRRDAQSNCQGDSQEAQNMSKGFVQDDVIAGEEGREDLKHSSSGSWQEMTSWDFN